MLPRYYFASRGGRAAEGRKESEKRILEDGGTYVYTYGCDASTSRARDFSFSFTLRSPNRWHTWVVGACIAWGSIAATATATGTQRSVQEDHVRTYMSGNSARGRAGSRGVSHVAAIGGGMPGREAEWQTDGTLLLSFRVEWHLSIHWSPVLIFVRRKTLRKKKKRQVDFGEPWTSHKHTHTKKEQGKHTKVSKEKNQISIGSFSPCPVELDASQWGISPALHTFSLAYFCTVRSVDWTLGSHSHWPMWKSLSGPIEDEICKGTVWKMRGQSFERYRSAKHQTAVVGWLVNPNIGQLPACFAADEPKISL